jgi:hypothetical protein
MTFYPVFLVWCFVIQCFGFYQEGHKGYHKGALSTF